MGNPDFRLRTGWLAAAVMAVLPAPSPGQGPVEAKNDTSAARLEEMGRVVRAITLSRDEPGGPRPVELGAGPLHRWSDPTREFNDGALWVWGGKGRPLALTAI